MIRYHDNQAMSMTLACAAILSTIAFAGCGESKSAEAAALIDLEADAHAPAKDVSELPVGEFRLSVPVDLGEYDAWYRVTFRLAVGVHKSDKGTVADFIETHKNRLRRDVAGAVRNTGIENLDSAKLSELRLQMTTAINESIGQPLVQGVFLADFSAEVQ